MSGGVVIGVEGGTPRLVPPEEAQRPAGRDERFWRGLDAPRPATAAPAREVDRSAITLKLMTYARRGPGRGHRPPALLRAGSGGAQL